MVPKGDIVRRVRRCRIAISDVLKHAITQTGSHDSLQSPGNWLDSEHRLTGGGSLSTAAENVQPVHLLFVTPCSHVMPAMP